MHIKHTQTINTHTVYDIEKHTSPKHKTHANYYHTLYMTHKNIHRQCINPTQTINTHCI
jgi:hypothetical protein